MNFTSARSRSALALMPLALAISAIVSSPASAGPLSFFEPQQSSQSIFEQSMPEERVTPPDATAEDTRPDNLRRQIVDYRSNEKPGTVIVDTAHTYLYYVMGGGKALRYGIGVGREGFTWSGVKAVERKAEWPDWRPPAEMIARQPYLPRFMAGGPSNPLGARAMYIGGTVYRIHGTNAPDTIGQRVSSGCIRLVNADVEDLYNRVQVGAKVIVLPNSGGPLPVATAHAKPATHTASVYSRKLPQDATVTASTRMSGVY